jgi:16S rRNA A1518/A1519 N6-dimethyltransferase RsmA/KsgA/DIM1 with predicted DNA glycosylase/AP lyase activity
LANALAAFLRRGRAEIEEFLRAQQIEPARRGETLEVEEFIKLARAAREQHWSLMTD